MAEEPAQVQSIQARIAALNLGHVGRAPITATPSGDVGESRPQLNQRSKTANVPTSISHNNATENGIGNEPSVVVRNGVLPPPTITRTGQKNVPLAKPAVPSLPLRKQSSQPSPALPPRRPSGQLSKKDSAESISSTVSSISTISTTTNGAPRTGSSRTPSMDAGRRMPPAFDPAGLPPLPPKRTQEQVEKRYQDIERSRMGLKPAKSSTSVTTTEIVTLPPALPSRPPQKPPRTPARTDSTGAARKLPSESMPTVPVQSALSLGMNKPQEAAPPEAANEEVPNHSTSSGPPPVPLSSRPDLARIQASKPKSQFLSESTLQPAPATTTPSCLTCRDFSGPDSHAAKFPRESVPSLDWLATQLVSPFSSPTDQARVIFSWLHHNVAYDIVSFCNNNVQPSNPMNTITTGLAVCEGYAGLFTAIASKVGLESLVVSGHGKGAGFSPLEPGEPIPPESSNHAWNAVKIDNGEWKLIDTCWGAGHVCIREQKYTKKFAPRHFTKGNNEFGQSHFPTNKSLFYRTDGRAQISWEEYILGPQQGGAELVRVYSGAAEGEGLAENKFVPANLKISTKASAHQGPTVRFQFERVCEHWDPVRNGPGKPYTFILNIHGKDGREKDYVPFETNGFFWWVDVPPQKLGAPGQTVNLYTVETVSGQSARGLTTDEYRVIKGRKAMSFGGVAAWELV